MSFNISFIQPERELVHVPRQMLLARVVVGAVQAALQHSPNALDRIRRDFPAHVFFVSVVHALALVVVLKAVVGVGFVRVNLRSKFHRRQNLLASRQVSTTRQRHRLDAPRFFLAHSKHARHMSSAALRCGALVLVHRPALPADKAFINLYRAAKRFHFIPARLAQTVKQEPSRRLRDRKFLAQLHRGDTLASGEQQVHAVYPLVQRNVRGFKHRALERGEIFLARVAAVKAFLAACLASYDPIFIAAERAHAPKRPDARFDVGASGFRVWEKLEQLAHAHCQTVVTNFGCGGFCV